MITTIINRYNRDDREIITEQSNITIKVEEEGTT